MLRLSNTFAIVGLALLTLAMTTGVFLITNVLYGVIAAIAVSLVVSPDAGLVLVRDPGVPARRERGLRPTEVAAPGSSEWGPSARLIRAARSAAVRLALLVHGGFRQGVRRLGGLLRIRRFQAGERTHDRAVEQSCDEAGDGAGGDGTGSPVEREDPHGDPDRDPQEGADDETCRQPALQATRRSSSACDPLMRRSVAGPARTEAGGPDDARRLTPENLSPWSSITCPWFPLRCPWKRGRGANCAPLPRSTECFGQALLSRSGPVLNSEVVVPLPLSGVSERAHPLSCS